MADPLRDSVMVAELPQGFTAIDDPKSSAMDAMSMIYDRLENEPTNREIMNKLDGLERIIRRVGGINTKVITAITSTKMLDPDPADEIEVAMSGHWVEARVTKWITE